MTAVLIRIWLDVSHLGALRIGGFAFVRHDAGGLSGTAGGGRMIDAERSALQAFDAALAGIPDGAGVNLASASPLILAIPARIAAAKEGDNAPEQDLDLWARADTHLKRLTLAVRHGPPGGPQAFTTAWAERARDIARAKGAFSSAIPKPNLAKVGI
jgi:hypothetical protein